MMSIGTVEHEAPDTGPADTPVAGAAAAADRGGERGQVMTSDVGLHLPRGLTFEAWERAGQQLSGLLNSSSWWLGDWLVYGKSHYTDRYQRGIRAAGLSYQTLRNYAWVARRFEIDRRRPSLSFAHHAELASLPTEEQNRWLDRSEQRQWTTKQLRNAICAERTGTSTDLATDDTRRLAVPRNRLGHWSEAAQQIGTELEEWVLSTLDNEARKILEVDAALSA